MLKHMMKHSAVMVSSPSQARTQTFHLDSNYSISWVDSDIVDPSSGSDVVQCSDMTKLQKELNCYEKRYDDGGCDNDEEFSAMMNDNNFVTLICLLPRLFYMLLCDAMISSSSV